MPRQNVNDRERPLVRSTPEFALIYGDHWQVLAASVHDVRYFAALLRGVNFVNVRNELDLMHRHTITRVFSVQR